ncbi:MAG: hypothetical protein CVV64_20835 [Candidatus Wallbacteria bacterium HGW-Wallbacteria-1]|jgi:hypothetical protein|uniref:Uncharacterized protein n=1 Tax=Candidatus Wallbacteria bacterium HGW-Wallbacteria-1 TaxID=2013854 RepID=A0A2N1PI12_9BACT|nr:MAG: hypothetical protein CVV64_20835 [Candidatus Wallbacteria bacterium HGW-Wallbacteria-1]PKL27058.1 MAG: hypothetical protein CVV46_13605 [Spirochaetae bacterium HGW-Spirochaetae-2]
MQQRVLLALLLILFLVLIGCTGCDPNQTGTIDLTRDASVLTTPLGWIPQDSYTIDAPPMGSFEIARLDVISLDNSDFSVNFYDAEDNTIEHGIFTFEANSVVYQGYFLDDQTLLITATEETEPVLSLTDRTTGEKMFFSMGGSE